MFIKKITMAYFLHVFFNIPDDATLNETSLSGIICLVHKSVQASCGLFFKWQR